MSRSLGLGSLKAVKLRGKTVYVGRYTDARGVYHRVQLGTDRVVAQQRLNKLVLDRDLGMAGLYAQGAQVTFADLVNSYLEDVSTRATAMTLLVRQHSLQRFQIHHPGITSVWDVTPDVVRRYMARLSGHGLAPATVNNDLSALKACLNLAVRCGKLQSNPIQGVRPLPVAGKQRRSPRALDDSEVQALLAAAYSKKGLTSRQLLLQALIETGARWGELTRVTWSDVVLGPVLILRAAVTKNRCERRIPVSAVLVEALKKTAVPTAGGYIFTTPRGKRWTSAGNFRRWLDRLFKKAGIAKRTDAGVVNIHALRHTFVTRLARAGVPIQQAAYLSGHRTLRVLMDVYTHLQVEDVRAALERANAIPCAKSAPNPDAASAASDLSVRNTHSPKTLRVVGHTRLERVTSTMSTQDPDSVEPTP